ncbi:hypothetical protein E3W21_22190 [Pseudomonas sp. F01002]|nr:hypothetical protein E3W21_22190 [Pseudomonas sp. F01002]
MRRRSSYPKLFKAQIVQEYLQSGAKPVGWQVEPTQSFLWHVLVELGEALSVSTWEVYGQRLGVTETTSSTVSKLIETPRPSEGTTHAQISLINCRSYLFCAGLWLSDYIGRSW